MAIQSNNTIGNPYHDEATGQFTSKNGGGSKQSDSSVLNMLGVQPTKVFRFVKGDIRNSVPQINLDGSKRVFVADLPYEKRIHYIENLRKQDINNPLTDNDNDTMDINTVERQAFREQSIEDEINKQKNEGEKSYDHKATVILGIPASGKSTLAQYLKKQDGAFEIDSDFFTEKIPEFQEDPAKISAVHREASYMSKKMMNDIAKQGGNMIIGKVGGGLDISYLEDFLNDLQKNDYEVELVLNDLPLEEGLKRNMARHQAGNPRLVPAMVSIVADRTVHDNMAKLMNHPSVVGGAIYSNDVPQGTPPKFIRKLEKEDA